MLNYRFHANASRRQRSFSVIVCCFPKDAAMACIEIGLCLAQVCQILL